MVTEDQVREQAASLSEAKSERAQKRTASDNEKQTDSDNISSGENAAAADKDVGENNSAADVQGSGAREQQAGEATDAYKAQSNDDTIDQVLGSDAAPREDSSYTNDDTVNQVLGSSNQGQQSGEEGSNESRAPEVPSQCDSGPAETGQSYDGLSQ